MLLISRMAPLEPAALSGPAKAASSVGLKLEPWSCQTMAQANHLLAPAWKLALNPPLGAQSWAPLPDPV